MWEQTRLRTGRAFWVRERPSLSSWGLAPWDLACCPSQAGLGDLLWPCPPSASRRSSGKVACQLLHVCVPVHARVWMCVHASHSALHANFVLGSMPRRLLPCPSDVPHTCLLQGRQLLVSFPRSPLLGRSLLRGASSDCPACESCHHVLSLPELLGFPREHVRPVTSFPLMVSSQ